MTTIKGKADAVLCEEGFETDFASIPEWIFFLRPRNGKWAKASVIHDKACIYASNKEEMTYKQADHIFYNAMREDGASVVYCRIYLVLGTIKSLDCRQKIVYNKRITRVW